MEELLKISKALIKISEGPSASVDMSGTFKPKQEKPKKEDTDIKMYSVENPVDKLIPGGINVY